MKSHHLFFLCIIVIDIIYNKTYKFCKSFKFGYTRKKMHLDITFKLNKIINRNSIFKSNNILFTSSSKKNDKTTNNYRKDLHKYPRIHINQNNITVNSLLTLDDNNSHYILNVIRLKNNFFLRVFNDNCGEYLGK
jgi:hypothetical protein